MMDINPDTSSNEASSLKKPGASTKSKVSSAGSAVSKGGSALASAAGKASDKASEAATTSHQSEVSRPAEITPSFHKGGTVKKDGTYRLQAGEHVLTEPEAEKAKKHAIMASGIKSLANAGAKAKKA
jgi:hypothetical protein